MVFDIFEKQVWISCYKKFLYFFNYFKPPYQLYEDLRSNCKLTKGGTIGAGNEEGVVALGYTGSNGVIEHKTVSADFLGHFSSVTVVVFVTLNGITVVSIIRWAYELLSTDSSCGDIEECD